jgi:hypothetical protein
VTQRINPERNFSYVGWLLTFEQADPGVCKEQIERTNIKHHEAQEHKDTFP